MAGVAPQHQGWVLWAAAAGALAVSSRCGGGAALQSGGCDEKQDPEGRRLSLREIEELALPQLAGFVREYYQYIAGEGHTIRRLLPSAFHDIVLTPRIMVDVHSVSTELTLFGQRLRSPIMVAPTTFHRLAHADGEAATARGAAAAGCNYCYNVAYSTVGAAEVAAAAPAATSPRWAHLYLFKDRAFVLWMVRLAERSGFAALIVTCDHAHDRVRDMTMPAFDAGCGGPARADGRGPTVRGIMNFPNVEAYRAETDIPPSDRVGENDDALTWVDLRWLCDQTRLPVVRTVACSHCHLLYNYI